MISYSDEIHNGFAPNAWREAAFQINNAFHAIGREFGDQVHTSGRADYLVRCLVNVTDLTVRERVSNYFLILVSDDGIATVTKVGEGEPFRDTAFPFRDGWENELCNRFRAFRKRLA